MMKKLLGAALCLALFWTTGCVSLAARKMEIIHLQNARNAAEHNARMRCLEEAKAKAYTASDQSQPEPHGFGGRARDYATPTHLDYCTNINY